MRVPFCRLLGLFTLLLAVVDAAPSAAQPAKVPPGGDAALACGQKPDGRAYWSEYGFCDLPVKGPGQAKGLVFWSHGVDGDKEQFNGPVPPVVRALQLAGWDVQRINRNNLFEKGWESSGTRHRDDAIERVRAAKAQGYRQVILAGQSYGAMISFAANSRSSEIDGVMAFSPGTGSDADSGATGRDTYRSINRYLLQTAEAQKGGRVVVLFADGDRLHPDRGLGSGFGAQMRAALATTGRPYVVFDETTPIRGHGAGTTNQFSAWFGGCLLRFFDPAQAVAAGETVCRPPDPVPRFFLPANLKIPKPGTAGPSRWLGAWQGTFGPDSRDVMIVVEAVTDDTATVVYAPGAGPRRDLNMGYDRYSKAVVKGDTITIDRGGRRTLTLVMSGDDLSYEHTVPNGPSYLGHLSRGN